MARLARSSAWPLALSIAAIMVPASTFFIDAGLSQGHPISVGQRGYALVDDGGPGYSEVGTWKKSPTGLGIGGSERAVLGQMTPGAGNAAPGAARWTVRLPDKPALYEVLVTWQAPAARPGQLTTAAPFRILSGVTKKVVKTVPIDQSKDPSGEQFGGRRWQSLGNVALGTSVIVDLRNGGAKGVLLADAVWIRSAAYADLEITQSLTGFRKEALPLLQPGSRVEYAIAMRNRGPLTATHIIFKDQLPAFLTLAPLDESRCSISGEEIKELQCEIPLLPKDKQLVFYVRGIVSREAPCGISLRNRVGVMAREKDRELKTNFSELTTELCGEGMALPPRAASSAAVRSARSSARPARPPTLTPPAQTSSKPKPVAPKRPPTPEPQKGPTDFALRMVSRATIEQGGLYSATVELRATGPGSAPAFIKITMPPGVQVLRDSIDGCAYAEVLNGTISCYMGNVAGENVMPIIRFSGTVPQSAACDARLTVQSEVGVPEGDTTPLNNSVVSASKVKC